MGVRQTSPDNAVRLRRFLIASFMAQTIATAGVLAVPIVLPLARADAGSAALDIGTYVGALYLVAATSALFGGASRLIQKWRRIVMFFCPCRLRRGRDDRGWRQYRGAASQRRRRRHRLWSDNASQ
jgi:hypothetical protein